MTKCTKDSMGFSSMGRREVVAVLLLTEIDRRIGLLDVIKETVPDLRDPLMTVRTIA